MYSELNKTTLNALEEYTNIVDKMSNYKAEDFVTYLDTNVKCREAIYTFFKKYGDIILSITEYQEAFGNRQLTNRILREVIMEFKLSRFFD